MQTDFGLVRDVAFVDRSIYLKRGVDAEGSGLMIEGLHSKGTTASKIEDRGANVSN